MRRLAAAGGVLSAADLDLQVLEAGAEVGLEEEVQYVAAVGFGIVEEQARSTRPALTAPTPAKVRPESAPARCTVAGVAAGLPPPKASCRQRGERRRKGQAKVDLIRSPLSMNG